MSGTFEVHKGYGLKIFWEEVSPQVEAAAKRAISMVWNHHVGEPQAFSIIFCSRLSDPKTGEITSWSSEYGPDLDVFKFALDTMRERMKFDLPDDQKIILLAAHEAMHKVQFHRGDEPKPSSKKEMGAEYYDDRHEIEALTEALEVFKAIFPNASGGFTYGGRRWVIPGKTKYR